MKRTRKQLVGRGERQEMRDYVFRHLYLLTMHERDVLVARYGLIERHLMPEWEEVEEITQGHVDKRRPGAVARFVHDCAINKILRHSADDDAVPFLLRQPHADMYAVKQRARMAAQAAYHRGRITKEPCAKCGSPDSEMHHPNYNHALRVVWLCKKCHAREHQKRFVAALERGATWTS